MGLGCRTLQGRLVQRRAVFRGDHGSESPVQQRVGAIETRDTLNLRGDRRAHRLHVVMIPADAMFPRIDDRVRLDHRRQAFDPSEGGQPSNTSLVSSSVNGVGAVRHNSMRAVAETGWGLSTVTWITG